MKTLITIFIIGLINIVNPKPENVVKPKEVVKPEKPKPDAGTIKFR